MQAMRAADSHEKIDERIFGDGEFVERILSENREALDRRYALEAEGVSVSDVVERVSQVLGITVD